MKDIVSSSSGAGVPTDAGHWTPTLVPLGLPAFVAAETRYAGVPKVVGLLQEMALRQQGFRFRLDPEDQQRVEIDNRWGLWALRQMPEAIGVEVAEHLQSAGNAALQVFCEDDLRTFVDDCWTANRATVETMNHRLRQIDEARAEQNMPTSWSIYKHLLGLERART